MQRQVLPRTDLSVGRVDVNLRHPQPKRLQLRVRRLHSVLVFRFCDVSRFTQIKNWRGLPSGRMAPTAAGSFVLWWG